MLTTIFALIWPTARDNAPYVLTLIFGLFQAPAVDGILPFNMMGDGMMVITEHQHIDDATMLRMEGVGALDVWESPALLIESTEGHFNQQIVMSSDNLRCATRGGFRIVCVTADGNQLAANELFWVEFNISPRGCNWHFYHFAPNHARYDYRLPCEW